MNYNKNIYLKLLNFQSQVGQQQQPILYFQFRFQNKSYFSSLIRIENSKIISLNQHFVFSLQNLNENSKILNIIRWENHMPIFRYELEIEQIVNKKFCRKKIETKSQQYLSLAICLLEQNQIQFTNIKYNPISHYYSFDHINYQFKSSEFVISENIPSFYKISVGKKVYIIPILIKQFSILIQLPELIQIQIYINNIQIGKSNVIKSQELQQKNDFKLTMNKVQTCIVYTNGRWGINEYKHTQLNYLIQTNEIILYQIEIEFDKQNDFQTLKLKFIYNDKCYELSPELTDIKKLKFKKIVYILLKSQDQQIDVFLQKNHLEFSRFKFFTYQFKDNQFIKKKIYDNNNREIGTIKFKVQRSKTLSLPQNNRQWRENYNKKFISNYLIIIKQISCYNFQNQTFDLHINGGSNIIIPNLINLKNYNATNIKLHQESNAEYFQIKDQNAIYFLYQSGKGKITLKNVAAMAMIEIKSIKLGLTPLSISMSNKDKTIIGYVNLLINKIPNLHFCKPNVSKQILSLLKKKSHNLSLQISRLNLSSYYFTYIYEKMNEIYCVIQINKHKKVLIFQKSETNELIFKQGVGSDYLNFILQENQYIQIKFTLLISDLGFQQQIYGSLIFKQRFAVLQQNKVFSIDDIEVKNQHEIVVGWISLKININQLKLFNKKFIKKQTKNIKYQNQEQNQKISKRYKSLQNKIQKKLILSEQQIYKTKKKNNHQQKLPPINKSLDIKHNFKVNERSKMKQLMEMDQDKLSESIKKLEGEIQNNKKILLKNKIAQRIQLMKKRKNQRLKPNFNSSNKILKKIVNRQDIKLKNPQQNLDILFHKQKKQIPNVISHDPISSKIKQYHEKLNGLKSILNQMNNDMKVQPSVNASARSKQISENELIKPIKVKILDGHDIEDNEFISQQLKIK